MLSVRIFLSLTLFFSVTPAFAWNPCLWTLDGSFTSTLFLRLHTMKHPGANGADYLASTRFQLKPHALGGDVVLRDPAGKNMGYLSFSKETLNGAAGTGILRGYSLDVYLKPEFQPSGLGTMLFLVTALHLEKNGFKLRAPLEYSEKAKNSFERLRSVGILKKVAAQKNDGTAVEIFEFDLSGLNARDRADLEEIRLLGPEAESPAR